MFGDFPGLFLYSSQSPSPKNPRRPHTTVPKPHQLKTRNKKNNSRPHPQNSNPQTTINEQKWEKNLNNNTGKKITAQKVQIITAKQKQ